MANAADAGHSAPRKKRFLLIGAAVLAGIIVVVAVFLVQNQQRDHIRENGVTTAAIPVRVDETRIEQDSGPDKRTYRAIFEYVVDGTTYTIMSKEFKNGASANAYFRKSDLRVIYLPDDPNQAILER